MEHLDIFLPIILLAISFLLKLVVDRNVDVPSSIHAICEFPVDVLFLSLSFSIAYTISDIEHHSKGFFACFVGLAVSILVVFIWKKTIKFYLLKNRTAYLLLLFLNLTIAIFAIKMSIELLTENSNKAKQEKIDKENKAEENKNTSIDSTKTEYK